ncbi:hypothetical protein [Ekhidna sp.]|uniref:tetratricopeptide repeat protein n=1 Tax=Ekhidna sp. TaxID=2608089 RepID=UPI003B5A80DB
MLADDFLNDAISKGSDEEIVQANFTMAYILDENGEYGKAIIYYLESIRHAEQASYDGVKKSLISLHKNCGVIFRKFKAFNLAKEYYRKGLELAHQESDEKQIISINYNLSGILLDESDYNGAVTILEQLLKRDVENSKYFDILNRLSYAYIQNLDFVSARSKLDEIVLRKDESPIKLLAYAYQNLGTIESLEGNFQKADDYFNKAIENITQSSDPLPSSVFKIYFDKAKNFSDWSKPGLAIETYAKAENLIGQISQHPEYFEIYKAIANIHFDLENFQKSKTYEDLYSKSVNTYLLQQEEIQQSDKQYNMDLITKRYFDEVAKQERIASILFYSKLISGSLLALLLMSVGFNWYQKVRLRRSIVRELIDLKILD